MLESKSRLKYVSLNVHNDESLSEHLPASLYVILISLKKLTSIPPLRSWQLLCWLERDWHIIKPPQILVRPWLHRIVFRILKKWDKVSSVLLGFQPVSLVFSLSLPCLTVYFPASSLHNSFFCLCPSYMASLCLEYFLILSSISFPALPGQLLPVL